MRLDELNALTADAAVRELLGCCGARRWAVQMAAARPFASLEQVVAAGDDVWARLDRSDWLEAFAAHPKIGELRTEPSIEERSAAWAAGEQSGALGAPAEARDRLRRGNRQYYERFGYIFIICATGRTAGEMAAELERRLHHDAAEELGIAAEEQRKITRIRLGKLLSETT